MAIESSLTANHKFYGLLQMLSHEILVKRFYLNWKNVGH